MRPMVVPVSMCVLLAAGQSWAQPVDRLAAIGDSLSDEYAEQDYGSYAMSWTELLVELRGIDMGPTGSWGEPRRNGYEDNWARFGHTTDDALATGQHTGVAGGIASRDVSHVVVYIGGNDFSAAHGPYADVYDGSWTEQQIDDYVDQQLANALTIVDTVNTGGAKVLVASSFDFGSMPRTERDFPLDAGREAAAELYRRYSERLRTEVLLRDLPFLDMYELNRAIFGGHTAQIDVLTVAGVAIDLTDGGGTTVTRGFVRDDIHPRTVLQGVWANAFITGLNLAYGTGIVPLSESEIVIAGNIAPAGPDSVETQIGPLSQFVHLPDPPPPEPCGPADANADGVLSPADFASWIAAFNVQGPACDQNGDGQCLPNDFTAWIVNYNIGCL
jgi:hypothetical protein